MRENEKDSLHQFDIWCANKNLAAAAKKKPCQALNGLNQSLIISGELFQHAMGMKHCSAVFFFTFKTSTNGQAALNSKCVSTQDLLKAKPVKSYD